MGYGKVLLTGAAGPVGGELLLRLLAEEDRRVVCLVSAPSREAARARGRELLVASTGRGALAGLVEWLPARLEQRDLGLAPADWGRLASEVEEVFHCAQSPWDRAGGREPPDARVAAEVLRLCLEARARGGFRRLNHLSSAWAAGLATGEVQADRLPEDRAERFRSAWERTQARAERLLRARWDRVPTMILRPSLVVGESETGRTREWDGLYYPLRLIASGRLPWIPRGGAGLVDCVPVDGVAAGLLALSRRDDTQGRAFHLVAGAGALPLERVVDEVQAALRRCGRAEGTRLLGRWPPGLLRLGRRLLPAAERKALAACAVYAPYTRIEARFCDRRERALLGAAGVVLPAPTELLPRVIDYALRADFGRHPEPARRSRPVAPDARTAPGACGLALA